MRHQKKGKILGRTKEPRLALMRGLATSLVLYEKITTTEAKAKALRPKFEKLITLGKKDTLANRRMVLRTVYTEGAMKKIFEVLGPKYQERNGGYTRIVKLGRRQNDAAKIAVIELV